MKGAQPKRRSIRLRGYDYSQDGAYFITICTYGRECLFGSITEGELSLNEYGLAVRAEWMKTSQVRTNLETDVFVVMPNHFHAVLFIGKTTGTARRAATDTREAFGRPRSDSLPTVVRSFKAAVTKLVNDLRGTPGMPVWQRNYYEHVVRGEADLEIIRDYVTGNPGKWSLDAENPDYSPVGG